MTTLRLRALSLDLDGTLADTLDVCVASFQDVLGELFGSRPDVDTVLAGFGATEEGILERLCGRRDPAVEELWHARYGALLAARVAGPFAGVPELLDRVAAAGLRIAVVTGKGARSAAHTLRALGLARFVERVEPGGTGGCVKRDRLRALLADWDLAPGELAHLGDMPADVRAARATGVVALAAGWASTTDVDRLRAEGPDELFPRVEDFAAWLRDRLPRR
ncbi:MAG: HAD family hydrolase [Planctomycetes bacterium]|nr:HAD family hydrolase [Planctomycetota bacterium]